jgi:tRNA1Val (adenine37-N6)-methyltransferase
MQAVKKTKDFSFKQFTVVGGYSGMPVSTDGVLLGAWINAVTSKTILDIGTGTGLLSLMCAQRFPQATITAVELDSLAFDAAMKNLKNAPWSERLELVHANIVTWHSAIRFDTIICNPPYFNSGPQSLAASRAAARHTGSLSHDSLLATSRSLLTPSGKASYVLPVKEGERFIELALQSGWFLSRRCEVSTTETKPVNRLLIELSMTDSPLERSKLVINGPSGYSADFIQLTKNFYLKM